MNYFLHNFGYDDKLNIKKAILDFLRTNVIFQHVVDAPNGYTYDINNVLHSKPNGGIDYYVKKNNSLRLTIVTNQAKLKELDKHGNEMYIKYYDEGKVKYENTLNCDNEIEKLKNIIERLQKMYDAVQAFMFEVKVEDNKDMTDCLKNTAYEWLEYLHHELMCVTKRYIDFKDSAKIIIKEPYNPMSKKEWLAAQKDECERTIKFCEEQMKRNNETIAEYKEMDEELIKLYEAIEKYNVDIK